jgi:hypothetical protein
VIISVGYRVRSQLGTQFRIWVTQRLKEYIVKGFALNDERTGRSTNTNAGDAGAVCTASVDHGAAGFGKVCLEVDVFDTVGQR